MLTCASDLRQQATEIYKAGSEPLTDMYITGCLFGSLFAAAHIKWLAGHSIIALREDLSNADPATGSHVVCNRRRFHHCSHWEKGAPTDWHDLVFSMKQVGVTFTSE